MTCECGEMAIPNHCICLSCFQDLERGLGHVDLGMFRVSQPPSQMKEVVKSGLLQGSFMGAFVASFIVFGLLVAVVEEKLMSKMGLDNFNFGDQVCKVITFGKYKSKQ